VRYHLEVSIMNLSNAVTRRTHLLAGLFLVSLITACGNSDQRNGGSGSKDTKNEEAPKPPPKVIQTLNGEEVFVREYWGRLFSKCGEHYFMRYGCNWGNYVKRWYLDKTPSSEYYSAKTCVVEFVKYFITLDSNSISESDKLNGIEWEGSSHLSIETFRIRSPKKKWSDWLEKVPDEDNSSPLYGHQDDAIFMKKVNGKMIFEESEIYTPPKKHMSPLDCQASDIN
jgi:hypothetical protein